MDPNILLAAVEITKIYDQQWMDDWNDVKALAIYLEWEVLLQIIKEELNK